MDGMAATLSSRWFDGRSPRPQAVTLQIDGAELLLRTEDGAFERRYPLARVRWPERRTHGQRQTELPDGSLIQHADAAEWDAWWQAQGHREGSVVGWMQSWRATLVAMAGTVAFLAAAWVWGVPWLSTTLAHLVPQALEERIGEASMSQLQSIFLAPSELPQKQQDALRQRFAAVVKASHPDGDAPPWNLSFHKSDILGANAFALPGGAIVMTDDLVKMLEDRPDALVGVLAHELGHVQHRHGLDMLVRSSLVSALVGVVLGDASSFLATVPATLVTQSYSRDAEREADAHAAALLHAGGISPAEMAVFFERIQAEERQGDTDADADAGSDAAEEGGDALPISIASHPDHAERIRFFREWKPFH